MITSNNTDSDYFWPITAVLCKTDFVKTLLMGRCVISVEIGAHRYVLLVWNWAIKIAFSRKGRRASRHERAVWRHYGSTGGNGDQLCPIVASDRLGLVVIMRRAERTAMPYWSSWPDRQPKWESRPDEVNAPDPGEPKLKDWGKFEGRFVRFNYSRDRYC